MRSTISLGILTVALGLLCGPLSAQESTPESALPTQTDASGRTYLSGGIGETEIRQINEASKNFNLKLILAEKSGAYAADVAVKIVDRKGTTVLDVPAAGPLLLAKLDKGTYRVDASYEGKTQQKRVTVREGKPATLSFYW